MSNEANTSSIITIVSCIIASIAAAIATARHFFKKNTIDKKIDILKYEDVIIYFKQEKITKLVNSNINYICCVTKIDKNIISLSVFDKEKEKAINCYNIKYNNLDDILSNYLKEKDMVIFNLN